MIPLRNVNHIQAGWTIYHIPSHKNPSHLFAGEEIQITATAWPQMQFRLLGLYGKVNYSAASSVTVIGELQVKFSHLPDIYAWEAVVIFALVDPLGSITGAAKKVGDLIKGADI